MSELIVGELLHTADALLIEKLHIVASISIKEIVCAHAEPEQMDLTVGICGMVVDAGDIRRGKRAVAAQIRELIEIVQTVGQSLVATTGESADSAMVSIVDGAVMLFHVWHQVVSQVEAEHVLPEHRLRHASQAETGWGGQQLIGITVRQYHNHLLCLAFCQQVVEDIIHSSYLVIHLLRIGRTANQIEHGVFLVLILLILRGQIDHSLIRGPQTLGIIVDILQLAVGHIQNVVGQFAFAGRNLQQRVLEALVREVLGILRVHHTHAVDDKAIGIHVRRGRAEGDSPKSCLGIARHGVATCKLHVYHDFFGLIVLVLEGYGSVFMTDVLGCGHACHSHE